MAQSVSTTPTAAELENVVCSYHTDMDISQDKGALGDGITTDLHGRTRYMG